MNPTDLNRLQLLVSNTHSIKKEFPWQHASLMRLAALLYAVEDKEADLSSIRTCHESIKQSTGALSMFRGSLSFGLSAMLSLNGDPPGALSDTLGAYEEMKAYSFKPSDYLVVAAYELAGGAQPGRRTEIVRRALFFYDGMKKNHPYLTSHDDYIFAVMLGLSELEPEPALVRMEQIYAQLKPDYHATNSLQALSQVLVLGDADAAALDRLAELRSTLRERKLRMDKTYTLPSLGLLALLPTEVRLIADAIEQADAYLREQKGFGGWHVQEQERLLLSSAVVISRSVNEAARQLSSPTLAAVLTNLIAAQQATMLASLTAITVVNSSSN